MPDDGAEGEAGREGGDDGVIVPIITPTTVGIVVRAWRWLFGD